MIRSPHSNVYGLHLRTDRLIPGLSPILCGCDSALNVHLQLLPKWFHHSGEGWNLFYSSGDSNNLGAPSLTVRKLSEQNCYLLSYDDGCRFFFDQDAGSVWCTWPEELTLEDAATYLLGPILALVLRLKGITCLHASAFVFQGSVVALVGEAGSGKSTTAAALAQRGCPILSDDIVAMSIEQGTIYVEPGYPRLRLWPDSANILFGSETALSRLTPNWDKCYLDLTQHQYHFSRRSLPLAAIYLLSDRVDDLKAPFVEAIPGSQAFLSLIANSYASCLLDTAMRESEFRCLTKLLKSIPIRRVQPHTEPAYLPKLCDVIIEDLEAMSSSPPIRTKAIVGNV
jgi:hypothetical protein